ncbi:MAG: TetR/AcrR family transcriptional regulator C-terminal domain-containing protein [Bariatricus sp.]
MEKKTDLRIERTYLFLHNAFTELLEEKRFEDFTVNELCERAMIRRTTFYKHFADKYEYFTFYMKEICESFQKQLPPDVTTDDLNTYFLYMCRELLHFMEQHQKLVLNIWDSNMFPILLDNLSQNIMYDVLSVLRNMNADKKMSEIQMEGIAAFYSGGLLNTLRLWIMRRTPIDEEQFLLVISDFLNR